MKNKTEKSHRLNRSTHTLFMWMSFSYEFIQTQAFTRNYEIFIIRQVKKNTSDAFLLFVVKWNQQNLYAEKNIAMGDVKKPTTESTQC